MRRTAALRDLLAETHVRVDDLVAPLFVREGIDDPEPIPSLPGVVQHTGTMARLIYGELDSRVSDRIRTLDEALKVR